MLNFGRITIFGLPNYLAKLWKILPYLAYPTTMLNFGRIYIFYYPVTTKKLRKTFIFKFHRNYHCWNDVWINRPDLDSTSSSRGGYSGWHALDSTPQEQSGGENQASKQKTYKADRSVHSYAHAKRNERI